MKWIAGGEFAMGSQDADARADEQPIHRVRLDGFWIDQTLVTNAQFRKFMEATGYVTTAEKKPDWEEMKKQLPPGTPKPPEDKLVAASIVFHPPSGPVPLDDVSQWWEWAPGADWRHPEGPGSSIVNKDDYPVVQVSWDDAAAYARWAGKRLPTEAEFEYAARGGLAGKKYAWGDQDPTDNEAQPHCNIWQGHFPDHNTVKDGYERSSPVTAFALNDYGLYDMAGNVWEWCSDWYRPDTYAADAAKGTAVNPTGPDKSFDPDEPFTPKHVTRGGSFLCHASYCASYRAAARMKTSPDSSTDHTGFRCVASMGPGK
jgi:formylglycine-generating enzyme required for sulfatase activity